MSKCKEKKAFGGMMPFDMRGKMEYNEKTNSERGKDDLDEEICQRNAFYVGRGGMLSGERKMCPGGRDRYSGDKWGIYGDERDDRRHGAHTAGYGFFSG